MATTDAHVDEPLVAPEFLERRRYQTRLAETAEHDHTLVCLPTGLGKTTVSLLVTARRLHEIGGRALLLAPTKPLVRQHAEFYREALTIDDDEVVVFTGDVSPEDRAALFGDARVVIATPQVVENDLVSGRIDLANVTHCTFDECHRATGDYAYNYIAERYHEDAAEPLVTVMSASPGGDEEEILTVCRNLGVREVTVMTEDDADVAEYTYDTDVQWERIELPEAVREIRDLLREVVKDRMERLKSLGVADSAQVDISQKDLNRIRGKLTRLMDNDQSKGYEGMSIHAEVMKLRQALTLVETQSVEALRRYFDRQRNAARQSGASKASQRFVSDPRVREAMSKATDFDDLHPKYRRARILLAETLGVQGGERVIVFTESRDTAEALTEFLGEHFDTRRFVGQNDREGSEGMTQSEQQSVLEAFRAGEFEVLVSTSVAEEGLDVPEVDLVLFYEPVPTAIRSIQRKGRTGRQTEGKVVVLMAEDTRDEAYFWKSKHEEDRMEDELHELKSMVGEIESELHQRDLDAYGDDGDGSATATGGTTASAETADVDGDDGATAGGDDQVGLTEFDDGEDVETGDDGEDVETGGDGEDVETGGDGEDGDEPATPADAVVATARPDEETGAVEVVVDQREMDSSIPRDLSRRDAVDVRLETLEVGDYVLSDRAVVERKSVADFVDTLTGGDRSLFEQVGDAASHYARPVVVIEGTGLYEERNVHPNAIRGAVASLAVDFGASVLRTDDESDTTELLAQIADREQTESDREVSVHGEKGAKTLAEQQEYVVSSIADVGPVTATALLEAFGSVEAVMTATHDDLTDVAGVGEVTAGRIREVVGGTYDPD